MAFRVSPSHAVSLAVDELRRHTPPEVNWRAQFSAIDPSSSAGSVGCRTAEQLRASTDSGQPPGIGRCRGACPRLRRPTACRPWFGGDRGDAARCGLVGQSAQAISAKTQRWQATTASCSAYWLRRPMRLRVRRMRTPRLRPTTPGQSLPLDRQVADPASLTVEDVLRWDPGAGAVGDAARTLSAVLHRHRRQSADLPDATGPGSEEARQALEETGKALERPEGCLDAAMAAAGRHGAATNVQIVKDNLQYVLDTACVSRVGRNTASWTRCSPVPDRFSPSDIHNAEVLTQALQQVLAQATQVVR